MLSNLSLYFALTVLPSLLLLSIFECLGKRYMSLMCYYYYDYD